MNIRGRKIREEQMAEALRDRSYPVDVMIVRTIEEFQRRESVYASLEAEVKELGRLMSVRGGDVRAGESALSACAQSASS